MNKLVENTNKTYVMQECKCKFDGKKCDSNQEWNNDKCWC